MMHPSRNSVVVFAMDSTSTRTVKATPMHQLDNWVPTIATVVEFATGPLSPETIVLDNMDQIQQSIFKMGFGPMPFYRRCSVAVGYVDEREDGEEIIQTKMVSCVVPHRFQVNGCIHSQHRDCYFCPYNPFYELLVNSKRPPIRRNPTEVSEDVLPVGMLLLLDTECESFTALVRPSQLCAISKKRRRSAAVYDRNGVPVAPVAEVVDGVRGDRYIQVRDYTHLCTVPIGLKLKSAHLSRYDSMCHETLLPCTASSTSRST
jgi:hypothetical protein